MCIATDKVNIDFLMFDLLLVVNLGLAHGPHYVNAKWSCKKVQPIAYIQVV